MAAAPNPQLEVLDLRHFSAAQLRPLLQDEAARWQRRLLWDYARASATLLEYLDGRILPGYVALRSGKLLGYAFCVFEAAKAVIGDIYAFNETESLHNPVCETLLHHLIELLQATPGIDRIESQLLMFPAGALAAPYRAAGFHSAPRLFMTCALPQLSTSHNDLSSRPAPDGSIIGRSGETSIFNTARSATTLAPANIQTWQPEFYDAAADLIRRCYDGHMDSNINDQYRTMHGSQRFLHNIIRFPGCGIFDPANSWVIRNPATSSLEAVILCSRVCGDVGHITQLCVTPTQRGHGLGELLLQHCMTRLAKQGVHHISLTVTEANAPALKLYEANGFTTLHRFEAMVWDKAHSA